MSKQYYSISDIVFQPKSKNHNFIDRDKQVFGRLTVLGYAGSGKWGKPYWFCQCSCGNVIKPRGEDLASGCTQSCGCFKSDATSERCLGLRGKYPAEAGVYESAKKRCRYEKHPSYKYYGAKGIEFRFRSFTEFFNEVGPRPNSSYSLDRINSLSHYEVGNIRWATVEQQMNNRRDNHFLVFNGKEMTISQLSRKFSLEPSTVRRRLLRGLCMDCVVSPKKVLSCVHVRAMGLLEEK